MESSHKIVSQNGQHSWLYRECLKNHAATLGAHATDGCGEFIASPASVLTCAACGCHRNFHRRVETPSSSNDEDEDEDEDEKFSQVRRKKKKQQSHSYDEEAGSDVLLTLKTGGGGGGGGPGPGPAPAGAGNGKKKRFRSKFSREQKDGMKELAEKLGWQLQRRHEDMVEDGCRAVGVERAVFKVWMHNNKQKQKQKELLQMNRRQQQQHHHNNNNNNNNRMAMNSSSSSPSDRS